MTDLICNECGATATYADAQIADAVRSCGGDKHDWKER